ncbi:MAG TPA: SDR family NAD(P)-dependent oxidoreductase [Chryseolinea sp.]
MTRSAFRFSGKHVLITGGAQGIGLEVAHHFAREGARLMLFDGNAENLWKAQAELQEIAIVHVELVDVRQKVQVMEAVEAAEKNAAIDILINNAGIAFERSFLTIEEDEWRHTLDINLTGMFFVAQEVCKRVSVGKNGVVVNMGSKNNLDGETGCAHYNVSKGGVLMLTKTMALELARFNIRVNAVCPGYIQTAMSMEIDSSEFVKDFVDHYIPMNRTGKVGDVAPAFLFLASEESSFMTGQIMIVDGGQLAGQKPYNSLI